MFILMPLLTCSLASAQDSRTAEPLETLASMEILSVTTAPNGTGADGYAAVLSVGFSRWTTGSNIVNGKQAWVDGVRGWFDDGWRVPIISLSCSNSPAFQEDVAPKSCA